MWSCMTHVIQAAGLGEQTDSKPVTPGQAQTISHLEIFSASF